jgi:RHS repeat-associated protein
LPSREIGRSRTYRPTDGVLTAIKTGPTAGSTAIQNLSFDYDGNLTSRTGPTTETLTYDGLNRLTSSKQGAITYFDNGNIKKKADVTGTQAPADFTYDPAHPHAVASAFGYTLGYDANGNLISRTKTGESWSFRYAGFDKPRWMAKTIGSTTVGSEFLYNANRSRTVQLEFDQMSGGVPSRYVRKRVYGLGSTLEANYDNTAASGTPVWALKKVRIYVPGPDGIVGSREFDPAAPIGSQEKAFIYHYDHLGSIESITPFVPPGSGLAADSTGKPGRFSEDAWGQRRNPLTWSGAPTTTDDGGADSLTPRGFTGHEMLDDLGLVHMNGRIYDPLLGRFQSADHLIQFPEDLQSYNRYSYVRNNPLTKVDASGFNEAGLFYYTTIQPQIQIALTKEFGAEKANKILRNTNLGEAAGTLAGTGIVAVLAKPIEALAAFLHLFGHSQKLPDQPQTPPTPSEKPVELNKPKENSSGGKIDSQENLNKDTKKSGSPGRRGSQQTQDHIDRVRDDFLNGNPDQKHVAGGRDQVTGQPLPEEHIPGPDPTNPNKGGSFPDLTFEDKDGNRTRINTVDTNKNGTETARERRNADRIQEQTGEPVITIPKPPQPPPDDETRRISTP